MKTEELRNKKDEELLQMKKDLEFQIMSSHTKTHPAMLPSMRKNVRKEIARIKMLLHERKRENGNERNKENTRIKN